ncbi:MAG: formylglycine-generating enzyme family protein, partial [Candidatus Marinimicrobia bacterium]|nr:formylglycine-generating enzyme family protein [Candidatus Neomarinimicrobiota bacterium]
MDKIYLKIENMNRGILFFIIVIIYSSCNIFSPENNFPKVSTASIANINSISAQSGGYITPDTSVVVISKGVCWDTLPSPTFENNCGYTCDGTGCEQFISKLTGLCPETKYFVRAYATSNNGVGYGDQISFTTPTLSVPILSSPKIVDTTYVLVNVRGSIISEGISSVIEIGFCWGISNNPTVTDNNIIVDSDLENFSSSINGLIPGNTYYIRVYATNSSGTGYGNSISFSSKSIDMINVQGGSFTMGDLRSGIVGYDPPLQDVTLNDYNIAKYEVTQELFKEIMGNNPSYNIVDNNPVEQVSWYDAVKFCNALSEICELEKVYSINDTNIFFNQIMNGYRLPTEAEWEYAARGGGEDYHYSGTNYYWDLKYYSYYGYKSVSSHQSVGGKLPNDLGIY